MLRSWVQRQFYRIAFVEIFTLVLAISMEAKTCEQLVIESTKTKSASIEKEIVDSILKSVKLKIPEFGVETTLPRREGQRRLAKARLAEVKALIKAAVKSEAMTEAPTEEQYVQIAEKVARWARQSYQLQNSSAHSLADRPRIDVLARIQSWRAGLDSVEKDHFDLAAPRLSRYLWLRAHWASKGEPVLEEKLLARLIDEARPHYLDAVRTVSDRVKSRQKSGETQSKDDVKIIQLLTDVKSNSKLMDEERARMLEEDGGRSLIANVKNITLSVDGRRFENGKSLHRYIKYDQYSAFLGSTPDERLENLNAIIYDSLVHSVIYYPFDIESPRAKTAYKSHFADRVLSHAESTIKREAEKFQNLTKREGRSLNAKLSPNDDSSGERGQLEAARQTSHADDISGNETLGRLNFQILQTNPGYLPLLQARPLWILSQFMNNENSERAGLSFVGGKYRAWAPDAATGLINLSNIHELDIDFLAPLLALRTPKSGNSSALVESAKSFLKFLKPEELTRFKDFLLEPNSPQAPQEIREMLEVWRFDAGLNSLNVLRGRDMTQLLPSPRATDFEQSELRQLRTFFERNGGTTTNFSSLCQDYQKNNVVDPKVRMWVSVVLNESANELYQALPPSKRAELDESLEKFFADLAQVASDRKDPFAPPKPWWKSVKP